MIVRKQICVRNDGNFSLYGGGCNKQLLKQFDGQYKYLQKCVKKVEKIHEKQPKVPRFS